MQPERGLPKRRRQILDDETVDISRFRAGKDVGAQTNGTYRDWDHGSWIGNFMDRVAALVRKVSGKN